MSKFRFTQLTGGAPKYTWQVLGTGPRSQLLARATKEKRECTPVYLHCYVGLLTLRKTATLQPPPSQPV